VFPHDAANCSVLVVGRHLYVGTANGVYDGKVVLPTAASLVVLDKETGKLLGRDDGTISADVFHGQWSSPTTLDSPRGMRIVYGGGDGRCHGFVPLAADVKPGKTPATLERDWLFDCNPPGYRARGDVEIDYWALVRGKATSVDDTGLVVSPNEIIGSPVIDGNRVYVAIGQDPVHGPGRGALSCFAVDGTDEGAEVRKVWQYLGIGRALSTVAVADGLVYAAEYAGKVHCLDADTGALVWFHDTQDEIWSSTLVVDGKVYIGSRKGFTVLSAGREKKTLAVLKLGSPVWSIPCAANKTLFVASQRNLWAVEEQGEMP
jgi:outer membrane protein assembly factor BamB